MIGLTEDKFKHILSNHPIVPEETKQAALEAYKTFTSLTGEPESIELITFHEVEGKDVCSIILNSSPRPAYIKIKDPKTGQTKECLFIRTGNLTRQLNTPSAIHNYCKNRWS